MRKITVNLQNACRVKSIPTKSQFKKWVNAALPTKIKLAEVTIRLVAPKESQALNHQYRHRNSPTNILSFNFEAPITLTNPILGDLVICASIVNQEAKQMGKANIAHFAHITIHGVLHLLGYDHATEKQAEIMETLEEKLLTKLGFQGDLI